MEQYDNNSGNREELKQENDFLKLKMMLEHGAQIGFDDDIPAELENEFLRSVSAFEEQFQKAGKIKLIDKLGRPDHFKAVSEIPDDKIEAEWITLQDYMNNQGIDLSVCSPAINSRELYRFTIEELFEYEMDDISLPGMTTCFIYDEFYPDHKYNNEKTAVDACISRLFAKPEFFDFHFATCISLNGQEGLSISELSEKVSLFQSTYDTISNPKIEVTETNIENSYCIVSGSYAADFIKGGITDILTGSWQVGLTFDKMADFWIIDHIQVEGIVLE